MNFYRLIQGDCLKVLHTFESESVDFVVTDPPYGISFMGKSWDKVLPPKKAFAEMFRVLKPGSLAFVMSSPRQDVLWRMMSLLEGVGFELRQSPIYWTYASGFPKAYDVSMGIDVKFIREEFIKEHRRKPTRDELNKLVKEKRKVIGKYQYPDGIERKTTKSLSEMSDKYSGDDRNFQDVIKITTPYSNLAKKWLGWKSQTGLKPSVEVILMVNKPRSERTIVDNVLKHGTGAVNVDDCRIPTVDNLENDWKSKRKNQKDNLFGLGLAKKYSKGQEQFYTSKGRFPANLLVSDDVLDNGKITKSQRRTVPEKDRDNLEPKQYGCYGAYRPKQYDVGVNDSGGFSRFFSLDAWWRNQIKKLPKDIQKTFPFLIVPKASKSEREKGLENIQKKLINRADPRPNETGWRKERLGKVWRHNTHPTVKPLKLMSYLVTLGCPSNGVVLDPFLGSGTTMLASWLMGKSCIGIEINPEYCEIAKARCFNKSSLFPKEYKFEII